MRTLSFQKWENGVSKPHSACFQLNVGFPLGDPWMRFCSCFSHWVSFDLGKTIYSFYTISPSTIYACCILMKHIIRGAIFFSRRKVMTSGSLRLWVCNNQWYLMTEKEQKRLSSASLTWCGKQAWCGVPGFWVYWIRYPHLCNDTPELTGRPPAFLLLFSESWGVERTAADSQLCFTTCLGQMILLCHN